MYLCLCLICVQLDISEDDTSLSRLLLQNNMASVVTTSPYFATFQKHARRLVTRHGDHEASKDAKDGATTAVTTDSDACLSSAAVAKEIVQDGKPVEAGSLLMGLRGTASAMATFDASLSYVSKWWSGQKK